jgi:hypothetical protein
MYVSDLVRVLRRRWYVAIPGLLITILAAGIVLRIYPPSLQATGSVVFVSPPVSTEGSGSTAGTRSNPYLNFGAPLGATAEVVSAAVNSDQTAKQLKARGATGSYQVGINPNSSAPVLSVEATAGNNTDAMTTLNAVLGEIRGRLAQIQADAGAPRNQYITAQAVTASPKALPVHGSVIRALAVILLVGVLASCGGAVIVEGLARGRANKRAAAAAAAGSGKEPVASKADARPVDGEPHVIPDDVARPRPLAEFPHDDAESPATAGASRAT